MTPSAKAQDYSRRVATLFERIHREQMAGLPLLNPALSVATLGFEAFEGRVLGLVITPWMMSLLLFPGPQDPWEGQALGNKHTFTFPGGSFRFMVNVLDELGVCQMHSLHSPMHPFKNQAAALAEANTFLKKLLTTPPGGLAHDPVDEELLGKILRGEKVPEMDQDGQFVPARPSRPNATHPDLTETT